MRPRLTPAQGAVRHAVRSTLESASLRKVLVAVSGGADSLALASATLFVAKKLKIEVAAAIIDHGLQAVTATIAQRTKTTLQQLGYQEVVIKKVSVGKRGGLEAAARSVRYRALEEIRSSTGSDAILLGHTQDDQAETVLLGLVRGSGARSLSGMSERTGRLLRPLLAIERKTTEQFCKDEKLKFWSDPHNSDLSFLRVRVRRKVLPVLERELGPGITKSLTRSADQLRADDEVLSALAKKKFQKCAEVSASEVRLDAEKLLAAKLALAHRVIKLALDELGVESSRAQVLAVADLIFDWHGQKPLSLPGVRVLRKGKVIIVKANQES